MKRFLILAATVLFCTPLYASDIVLTETDVAPTFPYETSEDNVDLLWEFAIEVKDDGGYEWGFRQKHKFYKLGETPAVKDTDTQTGLTEQTPSPILKTEALDVSFNDGPGSYRVSAYQEKRQETPPPVGGWGFFADLFGIITYSEGSQRPGEPRIWLERAGFADENGKEYLTYDPLGDQKKSEAVTPLSLFPGQQLRDRVAEQKKTVSEAIFEALGL